MFSWPIFIGKGKAHKNKISSNTWTNPGLGCLYVVLFGLVFAPQKLTGHCIFCRHAWLGVLGVLIKFMGSVFRGAYSAP